MNQIEKIIPAEEFARRRAEREQRRQRRAAFVGSILSLLDEEENAPASQARDQKETRQ